MALFCILNSDHVPCFTADHFKLDGFQRLKDVNESWEATELRHELFNKEWDLISSRIESIMSNMNTVVLSAIYEFVESAYTPRTTRAVMPIQELPTGLIFAGINVPDHDQLFRQIAQMLSSPFSPSSQPTTASSLGTNGFAEDSDGNYNLVVILQSKDCVNLKSTLKSMIEQFLGLGIAGVVNPQEGAIKLQNYDMHVLERWYQSLCDNQEHQQRTRKPPSLVVIIQDFESFDQDTLQDFITICSNYQDRIPLVFLMGLATSIDALHQGLPKSALSLLQTRKFQMQQSSECLTAIIDDLFVQANVGLMVGPLPLKQLIDQFMHYNFSVGGFVANLKYVVMHHFYANPLSILCDRSLSSNSPALELLGRGHFDHLRMLPSFQKYVESKVESDPQVAEMLLLDEEFLTLHILELVQNIREYHSNFALIFDFLWFLQSRFSVSVLKKSRRALYFMALEGALTESSTITFLLSQVRKLNSNDMMLFIEDWVQFFKSSSRCQSKKHAGELNDMDRELVAIQSIRDRMAELLEVVSEDSATSSSDIEVNDDEDGVRDRVQTIAFEEGKAGAQTADVVRNTSTTSTGMAQRGQTAALASTITTTTSRLNSTATFVKKRKLVSLKANDTEGRQTRIAQKTRETARLPKGALGTYTLLVSEIDELLARLFKTYLVCHDQIPLNEIFYYSQVTIQQKAFLPQPRASIQTALGQPELYLNCDCCHPPAGSGASMSLAEMVLPTQHDTCILYKLYVECGRLINMFDWFTAFGMILERGMDEDSNKDENDNDSGHGRKRAKTKGKKDPVNGSHKKKVGLDQKEVQARFITAVAELQLMGFIKPTNRKTDHVQRLTWGNI
ncbi:Origin recognition complex subunit 3 [Dissophora globulifera]|nr:Origin recognition complex subunit 3 [Dissophora globulifera]